jgi:excisionase family DNA binding protein
MLPSPQYCTDRHERPDPTAHDHPEPARIECSGSPADSGLTCPLAASGTCGMRAGTPPGTETACDTRAARADGTHAATGGLAGRVNHAHGADFASLHAAAVPAPVRVPQDARLWGPAEAATFLNMSESWVYSAARSGVLPAIRLGRAVRFDPATLRAWVRGERGGKVVQLPRCR